MLASVIVLDQFTRNVFRGSAKAFAADHLALSLAQHAIAQGWDKTISVGQCLDKAVDPNDASQKGAVPFQTFLYLPLEHAESIAVQDQCVAVVKEAAHVAQGSPYEQLGAATLKYAEDHRKIIERFGRFPHRNAVLGRESTPEEEEYLKTAERFGQ